VLDRTAKAAAWLHRGINANAPGVFKMPVPGLAQDVPMPPPKAQRTLPDSAYLNVDALQGEIWIDAKSFYLAPSPSTWVWGKKGDMSKVLEYMGMLSKQRVEYYAAVSYALGGLMMSEVTGTRGGKGWKLQHTYMVSGPALPLRTRVTGMLMRAHQGLKQPQLLLLPLVAGGVEVPRWRARVRARAHCRLHSSAPLPCVAAVQPQH
jgi:hypothetical protein